MIDSTPQDARPLQRVSAALINLLIVIGLAFLSEQISASSGSPSPEARAAIAIKALFGLCVLFWLACGHMRTSPGLVVMKLRVVNEVNESSRVSLLAALVRPLPYFIAGMVMIYPVELIPANVGPIQFFVVLVSSLLLAANAAPLWSGPNRRSLLDRMLKVRVIRTTKPASP